MTTLSTGRPSSLFAPAAPAPITRTPSAVAGQRRPLFISQPPSPLVEKVAGNLLPHADLRNAEMPRNGGGPPRRGPPECPLVVQVLRLLGRENGRNVVHRRVPRAQRPEPVAVLDAARIDVVSCCGES